MEQTYTSVSQALDAMGFGRVQWLLLGYCGLAWLADACETMLLSFLGPAIRCSWGVSPAEESLLTSIAFCGMLAGVYSLGLAADHLGRRRGFLASALLLGGAGLASAAAPSFTWLLLLRAVVGFALGGTPIAVTLFAEFCTTAGRGRWLLLLQSFWTLGTVLEALLAWAVLPGLGWRWLLALSALPLLALLGLYPLLPESAHWLVAKGRYAEAEAVLQRVAASNGYSRPLRLRLAPGHSGQHRAGAAGDELLLSSTGSMAGSPSSGGSMRSRSPGAALGGHSSSGLGKQLASPELPLLADPASMSPGGPDLGAHADDHREEAGVQEADGKQDGRHPSRSLLHAEGGGAKPGLGAAGLRQRARRLGRIMSALFGVIFSPQLRRTTLLLFGVWFTNALTYYGLVLLTTALQTAAKKEPCTPSAAPNLDRSDYVAILVTTLAEAPGLMAAALLIDGPGRKRALQVGLALCAAALASLVADPPRYGQLALLFVARACIEGTFSVLYVYTPELYPTAVRSFGLALCNGFSRFGGFSAPFATVYLVESGHKHAAELLLGTLCAAAAVAALLLPYETRGRDLQSTQLQPESAAGAERQGRAGNGTLFAAQRSTQRDDGCSSGSERQGGSPRNGPRLQGVQVQPHAADGETEVELEPAQEHHDLPEEAAGEQRPLLPPT
ncbi:hypothetical protein ABPG75_009893 [Micractinium tetrahymenae]